MEIIEAFAAKNKCYQVGALLRPQGLMLHSIGCPQPNASVMAQNFNQYRPNGQSVCVHAFVQRDGTVYQTLPWTVQAWHCGGSANSTHIGIEMTEPASIAYTGGASWRDLDPDATEAHVRGTYAAAVELFADLCNQFDLNPLEDGVIISHAEGAARGIASAHADPTHLWRAFGLTMDGFRADVATAMAAKNTVEEDEDMIRYHSIDEMPSYYREEAAQLVDSGALQGDNGDLDVSEDMIRGAIIGMRYAEARNPCYYSIGDVPAWARDETRRLIERGALQGDGKHELNVTYDALQAMIVCQRMIDAASGK